MNARRSRGGYTLLEALFVLGIMGFIGAGTMAMMVAAVYSFDNTTTEAFTDTDAVIAMQMIVSDVREAKSIDIIDGGARLQVILPKMTEDGYYDRHEPDLANQIDYYLSDASGEPGHEGTWLWKGTSSGMREPLKKDISDISFEQDTSRSVKITITARNDAASGPKETLLTQRVVYLRNY